MTKLEQRREELAKEYSVDLQEDATHELTFKDGWDACSREYDAVLSKVQDELNELYLQMIRVNK